MENDSIERYYTSMERMMDLFDKRARKLMLKAGDMDEYIQWKKEVRIKLKDITGFYRMESSPLEPKLLESERFGTYSRDRMIIQTEPDIWMPFYVLRPNDSNKGEKRPCIIATHGHSSGGKAAVVGRTDTGPVNKEIHRRNWDYGLKLVQQGYVVFCPDARGFGERREWMNQGDGSVLSSSCNSLNRLAISLGMSLTGMWIWDLTRLVDFIQMYDGADADRIGCAGLSGGGLQALWLPALDDRIKCTNISGYFYGYKDALLKIIGCSCNYVPHLWENADMGDIGALIAPRPLLIESGTMDELNGESGIKNVNTQVEITRKAYRLFSAEDRLYHHIFEGVHKWDGAMTMDFFKKWL